MHVFQGVYFNICILLNQLYGSPSKNYLKSQWSRLKLIWLYEIEQTTRQQLAFWDIIKAIFFKP